MASSSIGALSSRLARHFAGAAVLATAASATADVNYSVYNQVIPANIDGLYINVETGLTGSSGASTPGWDINPYSSTSLTFFNASGTGMMRYPGVTTGSAGNLAQDTSIDATGSFGGGAVVFGANPGNWQLNSTNLFGFRFVASDGLTHYAWGRIAVGATVQDRTLVDLAWETFPDTPILAGNEGGPPPAYDPCAPFNPSANIGANNLSLNQDTSTTLDLSGSCGLVIYKANFFKFTAPISGDFVFRTCGAGADTRMAILDGCDASTAATIGCNDDACGAGGSEITLSATEGGVYYIVIGATSPKASLPSPIALEVVAPTNPACLDAMPLAFGENAFDNTASTTVQTAASTADGTGTATIQKAQWFSFTAGATGAYSIGLCGASGDTILAIGTACPGFGQKFATIAYNDDSCALSAGTGLLASFIDATNGGATGTFAGFPLTQDLVAGETYYILAGSFSATANVTATLVIDGPPQGGVTGDFDGDGLVNASDLAVLLSAWGLPGATDLDGDGSTGAADLAVLLGNWSNG
jgi:hypothetical protein